jgi:hypothetical protein
LLTVIRSEIKPLRLADGFGDVEPAAIPFRVGQQPSTALSPPAVLRPGRELLR